MNIGPHKEQWFHSIGLFTSLFELFVLILLTDSLLELVILTHKGHQYLVNKKSQSVEKILKSSIQVCAQIFSVKKLH